MGDNRDDPGKRAVKGDERRARLAEAMRANLRRRKEQQRAREQPAGSGQGEKPAPDIEEA
jgi:hypothetical protein